LILLGINRDQNDTVVNLSSKDLKPAEIRILSKGLNFCPIPNKINEVGFGIHELFFLSIGRGISLSSSESDDPSTGQSLSSVAVMDKVDYLEEENRQLTDERFYKKLDSDPTKEFSTKITQELKIMKENSHIDKNTFVSLLHKVEGGNRRIRRFFLWGAHLLKQWVSRGCCLYEF
jgi:hypothetical protein